jgi:transposase
VNRECAGERAEFYYQQLDALRTVRQEVRRELLAEAKKHQSWKQLCQIPSIGPIRAAVLLGILQTPHRFRTKRQLRELQRIWHRDPQQSRSPSCGRAAETGKETELHSRTEPQL